MSNICYWTVVVVRNIGFIGLYISNFRNWDIMLLLGFVNRSLGREEQRGDL
jgi:hypothetical protein